VKAYRVLTILMIVLFGFPAAVSFASEDQAAASGIVKEIKPSFVASEESVITGMVQKYEPQKKIKPQAYQIVNEKKELFKIIGPKSITDQIMAIAGFEKLTFKFTGKIISKENKKGILISKFEALAQQVPESAKPAAATSEAEIKK